MSVAIKIMGGEKSGGISSALRSYPLRGKKKKLSIGFENVRSPGNFNV